MVKSKKIIFRVKPELFDFVTEFSRAVKMEKSELMRRMIEHYFLMYFSNNQTATYEDLKTQFLKITPKSPSLPTGEQHKVSESEEKSNYESV